MKVSACIITYNHENYIKECLEGAISQQLNYEYEIVIGEDCSSDTTLQICKEYSKRYPGLIRLLSSKNNLGISGNWKRTLQECKGDYIAICEGDDYWTDPLKLQKQVDFLENNPEYVLCGHFVGKHDMQNQIRLPDKMEPESFDQSQLYKNHIPTLSAVFRNCITNFPDTFLKSPYGDFFLWALLGRYGKYYIMSEVMGDYRVHSGGVWSGVSKIVQLKNSVRTIRLASKYITTNKKATLMKLMVKAKSGLLLSLKRFDIPSTLFFVKNLFRAYITISFTTSGDCA